MTELLTKIFIRGDRDPKNPETREKYGTLSSFVGIGVNLLLSAIKMIAGILSGSVAILADALNNLSDTGASLVTWISFRISAKPADKDHPFGHARIEYIASMIVSFLILLVGAELFKSSFMTVWNRLVHGVLPEALDFSVITIVILSVSIAMKLWLAVFYRKIGAKIDSEVVKASSADSLSDTVSTLAVLISTLVIRWTGFVLIDAIVGLLVAVLILLAGIKILNETKNSLLGSAPVDETVEEIRAVVREFPEIVGMHDLIVHNYGPNHFVASFHAEVDGSKNIFDLHDMIDNAERKIGETLGIQCVIHMDPIEVGNERVDELKTIVRAVVDEIEPSVAMHDFRAVIGQTHTNAIFDLELPFESKLAPAELKDKVSKTVHERYPYIFCVITVDRV